MPTLRVMESRRPATLPGSPIQDVTLETLFNEHRAELVAHAIAEPNDWIRTGYRYLVDKQTEDSGTTISCPFCNQNVTDEIAIIKAYALHFNEEFNSFVEKQQWHVNQSDVWVILTLPNGCPDTSEILYLDVCYSGINVINDFASLSIQPNPVNDFLNVNYSLGEPDRVKITIMDTQGKQLLEMPEEELTAGSYNRQLDVQKLASGIYLVSFQNEHSSLNRKFVKE
jgi:hypothetical protein